MVNIAARLEQAGKIYGVSPLISGSVYKCVYILIHCHCGRVIKRRFLCVWIASMSLRQSTVSVFHLVCAIEQATNQDIFVAQTFHTIRKYLNKGEFVAASEVIASCDTAAFTNYKKVLQVLDEHCIQENEIPQRNVEEEVYYQAVVDSMNDLNHVSFEEALANTTRLILSICVLGLTFPVIINTFFAMEKNLYLKACTKLEAVIIFFFQQ